MATAFRAMTSGTVDRRFCVAPMMACTDRHARGFMRGLSRRALLYTEMVTTGALIHGDQHRHLHYDASEHPVALQLGGSEPDELAWCARLAEQWGYDEVNLNVGCPSDRVQSGTFGACLMAQPQRVADGVAAMRQACDLAITVKCRIGIDDQDPRQSLYDFVETVAAAGCTTFIIHARKAWLQGLDPKQNRNVPPLDYALVYAIKRDFPQLEIIINGGITSLDECGQHLQWVDGVMLGREPYYRPWLLAQVDQRLFGDATEPPTRQQAVMAYLPHVRREIARGTHLTHMTRPIMGLFHGVPGARRFRRHLSENAHRPGADTRLLQQALSLVTEPDQAASGY